MSACANLSPGSVVKPISFADLWTRLDRIPTEKGEFEKSEDFDTRVSQSLKGLSDQYLLSANLDLEEREPESTSKGGFSYDADTQEMIIRSNVFSSDTEDFEAPNNAGARGVGVLIAEHFSPAGRYVGMNAMNAHVVIERIHKTEEWVYDHDYDVSISDRVEDRGTNLFAAGGYNNPASLFVFSLPPERARAFKKQLKIYIVVSPKAPYTATLTRVVPATFDDPREVLVKTDWIVADVTCAVLTGERGKVIATRPAGADMPTTYGPDATSLRQAP